MFGFSLQKLLVLAAIIAAVWYGFKFVGRLDRARKEGAREALKGRKRGERAAAQKADAAAEEMLRCDACGAYVVARGATSCGRDDCPYPG